MKILFLIGLLVIHLNASLYTSSQMQKMGFKIDGIYDQIKPVPSKIQTACNNVDLSVYNYNSIVRSGYLSVGAAKGNSVLAFIFYGKENATISQIKNIPTVIWMNGGPGSSSQLGNFMELGPLWIAADPASTYKIIRNNNSWVKEWNVLFVDQPVGTGLSYADPAAKDPYTHSMDDVAQDFYNALNQLYNSPNGCFSQIGIKPSSDLYIFGESYAGKYVPAISAKILAEKQVGGFLTGLKGMGIGDPFTHPFNILLEVGDFAYNFGLLDYQERTKIQQMLLNATIQQRNKQWSALHDSFDLVLDSIVTWSGGVNVYDIRSFHDYNTNLVGVYLTNSDVMKLYGLNPDIKYSSQSGNVYQGLYEDFMKPYVDRVQYCLSKNLPTIIYNGQDDLIVQTPGTMRWASRLVYKDADTFKKTIFKTWKVDNKVAGSIKSAGYLQVRIVNNAGHLVPMDQGKNALQMVKSFISTYKKQTLLEQ